MLPIVDVKWVSKMSHSYLKQGIAAPWKRTRWSKSKKRRLRAGAHTAHRLSGPMSPASESVQTQPIASSLFQTAHTKFSRTICNACSQEWPLHRQVSGCQMESGKQDARRRLSISSARPTTDSSSPCLDFRSSDRYARQDPAGVRLG